MDLFTNDTPLDTKTIETNITGAGKEEDSYYPWQSPILPLPPSKKVERVMVERERKIRYQYKIMSSEGGNQDENWQDPDSENSFFVPNSGNG